MTPDTDALFPASWEIGADLRRTALGAPPIRPQDMRRCWIHACLLWNVAELRAIRQAMQDAWNALPDARYRGCGNGQVLAAFLDATRSLAPPSDPQEEASAFLLLQWPLPRVSA